MNDHQDKRTPPRRVREPVQVYLDSPDQDRLDRIRQQLGASKSEVLRRGLEALEREILDPARHPALRIIGIAAGASLGAEPGYDVAREHDRFLAETEGDSRVGIGEGGRTAEGESAEKRTTGGGGGEGGKGGRRGR